MSAAKFIGLTCLVFLVVGPLVPIPTIAISAAISTGDISKLNGMFALSCKSYLFGWSLALQFGILFGASAWLLARFMPTVVPSKNALRMTLFGAALGVTIGCLFIMPAFISRISSMRMNPPFREDIALSLLVWWRSDALSSFTFFVLPSALCGVLATAWLLPKLLATPSLQRTTRKRASADLNR